MILKLKNRIMKSRGLLVSLAFVPVLSLLMGVATPMLQPHAYTATGSKSCIADRVFSYPGLLWKANPCVWTPCDGPSGAAGGPAGRRAAGPRVHATRGVPVGVGAGATGLAGF